MLARHAYPRRRYVVAVLGQDVLLAAAVLLAPLASATGAPRPFGYALGACALAVLAWGVVTLHFPSRIEIDPEQISFFRYGRVHRFPWAEVASLRVRRFLVRDRVLVRIGPGTPFRGRYWVMDGLEHFDGLVRELERRAARMSKTKP